MKRRLHNIWPLTSSLAPFVYLGVPTFKGKAKKEHLLSLSDKIKAKNKLLEWENDIYDYGWSIDTYKICDCWSLHALFFHTQMTYLCH